jgi:hypothetical protein
MSSPDNGERSDRAPNLLYAPKWVGDNRQPTARNPEIGPSKERKRSPLTRDPSQRRRSLELEIVHSYQPPPRRLGRFGVSAGFVLAVALGIVIGLFVTGAFPSIFVETSRLSTKVSEPTATLGHSKNLERASSPSADAVIAAPGQQGNGATNVATIGATTEPAPIVRGVTASEIRFEISPPLTGSSRELGQNKKIGIAAYCGTIHPIAMSSTIGANVAKLPDLLR